MRVVDNYKRHRGYTKSVVNESLSNAGSTTIASVNESVRGDVESSEKKVDGVKGVDEIVESFFQYTDNLGIDFEPEQVEVIEEAFMLLPGMFNTLLGNKKVDEAGGVVETPEYQDLMQKFSNEFISVLRKKKVLVADGTTDMDEASLRDALLELGGIWAESMLVV